jgi:peroxiredoxin
MGAVSLALRLALAGVLAVAAVGKLADVAGSRRALRDFRVPDALVAPLALALPAAELLLALALVVPSTASGGALAALALFTGFTAALAVSLRRGRSAPCHCFGRLHSAPVGPRTLARTAALAAAAGALAAIARTEPGPGPLAGLASLRPTAAVGLALGAGLLATVVAGAAVLGQVIAQNGRLIVRIDALEARLATATPGESSPRAGLPVGAPAPPFRLADVDGAPASLTDLRAGGRPVLLVFSDPDCGPCRALRPDLVGWQRDHAHRLTLALVSRGAPERNGFDESGGDRPRVLLQRDREVAAAYGAHATPTAVLVRPDGTIGSPLALGAGAIGALVATTDAGVRVMPRP